ncbi:unnamed protein product, partial [Coregonus sp. 'balchen']
KTKASAGWIPLHLACYFGHKDVVEVLLKDGADVNLQNNMGDKPLHKAAFTGRKLLSSVVLLLLRYDACAAIINGTAQLSKKRPPDIHCRDRQGNTPLHCAAYRGQKQRVGKMLKSSQPQDQELALYQTVFDLACSEEIKQILVGSHDKVRYEKNIGAKSC